ncbi:MAG: hypothetical protein ABR591_07375 [Candidatus Velthaea sp.]
MHQSVRLIASSTGAVGGPHVITLTVGALHLPSLPLAAPLALCGPPASVATANPKPSAPAAATATAAPGTLTKTGGLAKNQPTRNLTIATPARKPTIGFQTPPDGLLVGYNYQFDERLPGDNGSVNVSRSAVAFDLTPLVNHRIVSAKLSLTIADSESLRYGNNHSCITGIAAGTEFWWLNQNWLNDCTG